MRLLLCVTALLMTALTPAQADVPAGYDLVYSSEFAAEDSKLDYVFSDPNAWRLTGGGRTGHAYLEQFAGSKYKPKVRSPHNVALLATHKLGDFVMEADLMQTGAEYGHRDMCLFFGFQDPTHFYYAHISTKSDDRAHQIMIVNDKPRKKISTMTTKGIDWGRDAWRKVRLERSVGDGTVKVFFEDMDKPIMTAQDKTFGAGLVGFGSFDDTGRAANVKIWAAGAEKLDDKPEVFAGRTAKSEN